MEKYFKKIDKLVKQAGTHNPFEIAFLKDIPVIIEPLGTLNGYTMKFKRIYTIHINVNLTDTEKEFTCAHELGHIICNHKQNTIYLSSNTFVETGKVENEANKAAVHLLLKPFSKDDIYNLSMNQIESLTGIKQVYLQNYFM